MPSVRPDRLQHLRNVVPDIEFVVKLARRASVFRV